LWPELEACFLPSPQMYLQSGVFVNLTRLTISCPVQCAVLRKLKNLKSLSILACFYDDGDLTMDDFEYIPHVIFIRCGFRRGAYLSALGIKLKEPSDDGTTDFRPAARKMFLKRPKRPFQRISFYQCYEHTIELDYEWYDLDETAFKKYQDEEENYKLGDPIRGGIVGRWRYMGARFVFFLRTCIPFVKHTLILKKQDLVQAIGGEPSCGYHPDYQRHDFDPEIIWEFGKGLGTEPAESCIDSWRFNWYN
jgi:hypothetical protein